VFQLNPFKAAGTAPQSMVADFLNSQQDKDSELFKGLEIAMKDAASSVFVGGQFLVSFATYANWSRFHSWG